MLRSKAFHITLGFGVSAALIGWLIVNVEWAAVKSHLLGFNFFLCVVPLAIFILHYYIRALRWRVLLGDTDAPVKELFDSIIVGALATFLLPLRAGEFVRPIYLSTRSDVRFMRGFVSVLVERVFDLATVLGTFALLVPFIPRMPDWVYAGAWSLSVVGLALIFMIAFAAFLKNWSLGVANKCIALAPEKLREPLHKFSEDLFEGAAVLRKDGRFIKAFLLSVLVWGSCFLFFYSFLFLFEVPPSMSLAVTITVIVALAVAAPSAPGFVGVYQTATIAAFALFQLNKEVATAYSIINHLLQYFFFVIYGVYCLLQSGLKLSELGRKGVAGSEAAPL